MSLRDIVDFKIELGHLMEHIFVSKCLIRMHQDIGVGRVTQHKMCWRRTHLIWNSCTYYQVGKKLL